MATDSANRESLGHTQNNADSRVSGPTSQRGVDPHGEAPAVLDPPVGSLPWLDAIMSRLLAPDGCPWDREQTLESLRPYLIEECYEVLDAIDRGARDQHCEELGDVLLQIVFQAALAQIQMEQVIRGIGEKLIRRHPHVFGEVTVKDSTEVLRNWEAIKAAEKAAAATAELNAFERIPRALPALQRAARILRQNSKAGLPEPAGSADPEALLARLARRVSGNLTQHVDSDDGSTHDLVGNMLLSMAAIASKLDVEPEQALRDALRRYEQQLCPDLRRQDSTIGIP